MSEERKAPFSEREGHASPKPIQVKSLDDAVRARLWNVVFGLFAVRSYYISSNLSFTTWVNFLGNPADEHDAAEHHDQFIKKFIMQEKWFCVFDFLEFMLETWYSFCANNERGRAGSKKFTFVQQCNAALKKENAGYRIADDLVAPIVSDAEVQSIDNAIHGKFGHAGKHIKKALALFANRENPDYENSIKESASAIESISSEISGQKKISMTMTALVDGGMQLHPAFVEAIVKLFGFSSDEEGVRHASTGEPLNADQNTALFMLVICSAFVNYITAENPNINPRNSPRRK